MLTRILSLLLALAVGATIIAAPAIGDPLAQDLDGQLSECQGLYKKGMHQAVLSKCDSMLKLDPNCVDAQVLKGGAYLGLKKYDKARDQANTVIKLRPDLGNAFLIRGAAQGGLQNYKQAVNDCTTALKLDPGLEAQVSFHRADALQNLPSPANT